MICLIHSYLFITHFEIQDKYLAIHNFEKYQLKHCQCMGDNFNYQKQKVVNTHYKSLNQKLILKRKEM